MNFTIASHSPIEAEGKRPPFPSHMARRHAVDDFNVSERGRFQEMATGFILAVFNFMSRDRGAGGGIWINHQIVARKTAQWQNHDFHVDHIHLGGREVLRGCPDRRTDPRFLVMVEATNKQPGADFILTDQASLLDTIHGTNPHALTRVFRGSLPREPLYFTAQSVADPQ